MKVKIFMKKVMVISDIHGDAKSLKIVLDIFSKKHFDKLWILGDVLYHGPRNDLPAFYNPKVCIELLNKLKDKVICVKGNCDAEVDQMVLAFKIYNRYNLTFGGVKFHLIHGQHLNKFYNTYKNGDIVLYGHTHIHKIENICGIRYINPGSISLPKENQTPSFIEIYNHKINIVSLKEKILESTDF